MAFVKGDPRINRSGRPKNAEPDLLRRSLEKEGEKRGVSFWDKVAEYAFRDKNVMIAVVKKFIPDISYVEGEGFSGGQYVYVIRDREAKLADNNRVKVSSAPESTGDKGASGQV